ACRHRCFRCQKWWLSKNNGRETSSVFGKRHWNPELIVGGNTIVDTLIGTSIGGYKLIQSIGSGGMGTVYLAEDATIGQQVAIKIIRTDTADISEASSPARTLERFKQEARAIASLDHPHILPLYRYGEEQTNNG